MKTEDRIERIEKYLRENDPEWDRLESGGKKCQDCSLYSRCLVVQKSKVDVCREYREITITDAEAKHLLSSIAEPAHEEPDENYDMGEDFEQDQNAELALNSHTLTPDELARVKDGAPLEKKRMPDLGWGIQIPLTHNPATWRAENLEKK